MAFFTPSYEPVSVISDDTVIFLDSLVTRAGGDADNVVVGNLRQIDLSSQCNGANKTFTVSGGFTTILMLVGTQFPIIYKPTTDYTSSTPDITLTAEVGAPASGQTLIALVL